MLNWLNTQILSILTQRVPCAACSNFGKGVRVPGTVTQVQGGFRKSIFSLSHVDQQRLFKSQVSVYSEQIQPVLCPTFPRPACESPRLRSHPAQRSAPGDRIKLPPAHFTSGPYLTPSFFTASLVFPNEDNNYIS